MGRAFSPMDLVVPTPGALPQAGMERALGPQPALVSIALGPSSIAGATLIFIFR